jgi:hypothetical protein
MTRRRRTPPHDDDAELAVLGAMLLKPEACAVALSVVDPEDFYSPARSHVFSSMASLVGRGAVVDAVTVHDELASAGLLEAAGELGTGPGLIALGDHTPSIAHVAHYAGIVAEKAARRRVIAGGEDIIAAAYDGAALGDALQRAELLFSGADVRARRRELQIITVADVVREEVIWLWRGRLALRKVAMVDGDPELGKSTITLDLSARVSTGSPMPDGERLDGPGDVIIASAEDDMGDTIRPRLEAVGADLERVHLVNLSGPGMMTLPDDVPALQAAVEKYRAVLVIIDPLLQFISGEVDSYRDQEVRRALFPLSKMAADTRCAVMGVRHFTKGAAGGKAIYRGGASIAFIALARIGLAVGQDPDDPSRRLLAVSKCNIDSRAPTLAYRLVPDARYKVARIDWLGPVETTADEMVAIPHAREDPETTGALAAGCAFLTDVLTPAPRWVKDVKDEAKAAGLSWATVRRAKDKLGAVALKVGAPGETDQGWKWALP